MSARMEPENSQDNVIIEEPTAKYGVVVEAIRGVMPGKTICKMFCNGSKCKHCDAVAHSRNKNNVVKGLSSSWVNADVLAMSRPTQVAVDKYSLIRQFQDLNIKFIINLQEAFEHASCGQGILPSSGFSYDPELFMQSGISCGNFPWVDFGSPTISYALDIVQVMAGVVQDGGRVAVHCHAGRGRTGLIIACYLIYADGLTAAQAIHLVRQKRPKTIQTRNQVKFVQAFAAWIDPALRPLDARLQMEATPLTLDQVLENQKPYLHGEELKRFRHIPQLVVECVECTIVKLKEEPEFNLATPPADLIEDFEQLSGYINARAFQQLGRYSASTLCLFLLSWLQHLAEPVIDPSQKYMEHTPSTVATIGCCHRLVQAAKEHRSKSIAKEIAQRLTESLIQVQDEDEGSWLQAMLMSQSDS